MEDPLCACCRGETGNAYFLVRGKRVCIGCVEENCYYADPVSVCENCGAVISDEKYLWLDGACLCADCLSKAEKEDAYGSQRVL